MAARPSLIARSLSAAFGAAVRLRQGARAAGLLPTAEAAGARVVSVGNLRAGGSGKTPLVALLAARLRDEGYRVSVILRGYRGGWERRGGLVSAGDGPGVPALLAGDEAWMLARKLPGVRVRVGANRVASARLEARAGVEVVVLDDGFQHQRLRRDLDIVLVCPEDLEPGTRLLPAGPLREPAAAAAGADLLAGLARDWEGHPRPPPLLLDPVPASLVGRDWRPRSLATARRSRVWLLAGIARPSRFAESAGRAGFDVAGRSFFADHHRFEGREIDSVGAAARAAGADFVLTTEKDLARLHGTAADIDIRALGLEPVVVRGAEVLAGRLSATLGPPATRSC